MSLLDLYVLNFLLRPTEVWKSTFRPLPSNNKNSTQRPIFLGRISVHSQNLLITVHINYYWTIQ